MNIARKLDEIFDKIDDLMWANNITEIDNILQSIQIDSTSPEELIGYLTITLPVKSKLSYRPTFLEKVKDHLGEDDPELFRGLD